MRIIAGKYKRTTLFTLEGNDTRPTKDMVKEAMFSAIDLSYSDAFLDLFSGSGAMGIEALSRGAEEVVFNDKNKEAVKIIEKNLEKIKERKKVYNLDWEECLKKLQGKKFDYIFLDPPYRFKEHTSVFACLKEYELLKPGATIIWEVDKNTAIEENEDFICVKEKTYGVSKLQYYKEANV